MGATRTRRGFTLPELLVSLSIIAIVAGVAIPSIGNQRSKAVAASVKTDIYGASASVDSLLSAWRGVPPALVHITTSLSAGQPKWTAIPDGYTEASASGSLSDPGTSLTGSIWTDGSYALCASNSAFDGTLVYRSTTHQVLNEACPTQALGGAGTKASSVELALPGMPTGVTVTNPTNSNTVNVSWNAVDTALTYTVFITGQPTQDGITETSTSFPDVPNGTYDVTVYAVNDNGTGPGATQTVVVSGAAVTNNYYAADQAAKTAITGMVVGSTVYVADTGWIETYSGPTGWVITGGAMPQGSIIATGSQAVANAPTITTFGQGATSTVGRGVTITSGVMTIARAGRYRISFNITLGTESATPSGMRYAYVDQYGFTPSTTGSPTDSNGQLGRFLYVSAPPTPSGQTGLSASGEFQLKANTQLRLQVGQSSGGPLSIWADTSGSYPATFSVTYLAAS